MDRSFYVEVCKRVLKILTELPWNRAFAQTEPSERRVVLGSGDPYDGATHLEWANSGGEPAIYITAYRRISHHEIHISWSRIGPDGWVWLNGAHQELRDIETAELRSALDLSYDWLYVAAAEAERQLSAYRGETDDDA